MIFEQYERFLVEAKKKALERGATVFLNDQLITQSNVPKQKNTEG